MRARRRERASALDCRNRSLVGSVVVDVQTSFISSSTTTKGKMNLSEEDMEMLSFRGRGGNSSSSRSKLRSFGSRSEYRIKVTDETNKKLSYFVDWVFVIFLIVFSILIDPAPVFQKYISVGELESGTYSYPLRPNSFPAWALLYACLLFPVVVIFVCLKVFKKSTPIQLHHALLGLFMSLGFCNTLTCLLKLMIGRPRPDFLARCFDNDIPDPIPWERPGYPACTVSHTFLTKAC